MVGIFGVIVLGILALAGCGIIMMLSVAVPVMLVNYFRSNTKTEGLSGGAVMILIGVMVLIVVLGIELFKIFIPTVIELLRVNLWIGMISAVIMSFVITGPMIPLFTYKIDRRIDDLNDRISSADKRLDFDESHRLQEELKTAEAQYERRMKATTNTSFIVCMIVFTILYVILSIFG